MLSAPAAGGVGGSPKICDDGSGTSVLKGHPSPLDCLLHNLSPRGLEFPPLAPPVTSHPPFKNKLKYYILHAARTTGLAPCQFSLTLGQGPWGRDLGCVL